MAAVLSAKLAQSLPLPAFKVSLPAASEEEARPHPARSVSAPPRQREESWPASPWSDRPRGADQAGRRAGAALQVIDAFARRRAYRCPPPMRADPRPSAPSRVSSHRRLPGCRCPCASFRDHARTTPQYIGTVCASDHVVAKEPFERLIIGNCPSGGLFRSSPEWVRRHNPLRVMMIRAVPPGEAHTHLFGPMALLAKPLNRGHSAVA
jgi:hypothetical protein